MAQRPGEFKGKVGKLKGTDGIGHHVAIADLLDPENQHFELYKGLQGVDPDTGRSYFDVTNRSDNVVHLDPGTTGGPPVVNGRPTHRSSHPAYSTFMQGHVAAKVRAEFIANGGSFNIDSGIAEGPPAAFRAAGRLQTAYNNAMKKMLLGGIDVSDIPGDLRLDGEGATTVWQPDNYQALDKKLMADPSFAVGKQGKTLDVSTIGLGNNSKYKPLFDPAKFNALTPAQRAQLLNDFNSDLVKAKTGTGIGPASLRTQSDLLVTEAQAGVSSAKAGIAKRIAIIGTGVGGLALTALQVQSAIKSFEQGHTVEGIRQLTKLATSEFGAIAGAVFGGVPGSIAGAALGDYLGGLAIDSVVSELGPVVGEPIYGLIGQDAELQQVLGVEFTDGNHQPGKFNVYTSKRLEDLGFKPEIIANSNSGDIKLLLVYAKQQPDGTIETPYVVTIDANGKFKSVSVEYPDGTTRTQSRNVNTNELEETTTTPDGAKVTRTIDGGPSGEAIGDWRTRVKPTNRPWITGSQIGAAFGSTIGNALGRNTFEKIGLSSALGTVLSYLGGVFDPVVKGISGAATAIYDPIRRAFSTAPNIPTAFGLNLINAGIGAAANFFTAELAEALGIRRNSFGKRLFTHVGTHTIGSLLKIATGNVLSAAPIFKGIGGTLFKSGVGALTPAGFAASAGAFVGNYLASKVVRIKNIVGAIGANALSAIGTGIGIAAATAINAVSTAITLASTIISTAINFILPGIGAFIGYVFGAKIGNWLGKVFGLGVDHGGGTYHAVIDAGSTTATNVRIFNDDDSFGRPAREMAQATVDTLNGLIPKIGAKVSTKLTVAYHISNTRGSGRQNYVSVTGTSSGTYHSANGQALLGYGIHHALKSLDLTSAKALPSAAIRSLTTTNTTQILRQVGAAIAMQQMVDAILEPFGARVTGVGATIPNFNRSFASDAAVMTFARREAMAFLKRGQGFNVWRRDSFDDGSAWSRGTPPLWLTSLLAGTTATTVEALALQIRTAYEYHKQIDALEDAIGGRVARRLVSFNGVTKSTVQSQLETELVTTMKRPLSGGSSPAAMYIKRALRASTATTFSALLGDVRTAEAYALYLRDRPVIDTLIKQNPDSTLAAGWLITLIRAGELGLGRLTTGDFQDGFAAFLKAYTAAEQDADRFKDASGAASLADFELEVIPAAGSTPTKFRLVFARDAQRNATVSLDLPNGYVLTGLTDLTSASSGRTSMGTAGNDLWRATDPSRLAIAFVGAGDDVIVGSGSGGYLNGGDGDDLILGGDGRQTGYRDDYIVGGDGDDVIRGGQGNDDIYGGSGNDTFLYRRGDHSDIVRDRGGLDRIVFGADIDADDVVAQKSGNDLVLALKANDANGKPVAFSSLVDKLTLKDWYTPIQRVEAVQFADGTVLDAVDLHQLTGDTTTKVGLGASGRVIIASGTASIRLVDAAFGASVQTTVVTVVGQPELKFNARLNETLTIVTGADMTTAKLKVKNYAGATLKQYKFNGTAWVLQFTETYNLTGALVSRVVPDQTNPALVLSGDTLAFRPDVDQARVVHQTIGTDLVVAVLPTGHTGPAPSDLTRLEHVRFAADTVARYAFGSGTLLSELPATTPPITLKALAHGSTVIGTNADETLRGQTGADRLAGQGGTDRLEGREGADTYVFGRGSGADTIIDQRTVPESTRVETQTRTHYWKMYAGSNQRIYLGTGYVGPVAGSERVGTDHNGQPIVRFFFISSSPLPTQVTIVTPEHEADAGSTDTLVFQGDIELPSLMPVVSNGDLHIGLIPKGQTPPSDVTTLTDRVTISHQATQTAIDKVVVAGVTYNLSIDTTAQTVTLTEDVAAQTPKTVVTYHLGTDTRHVTIAQFNASNQKVTQTVINDDDTRQVTTYDVASAETWSERTLHYTAAGKLTHETRINDDGTTATDHTVGDNIYTLARGSGVVTITDTSGLDKLVLGAGLEGLEVVAQDVGGDRLIGLLPNKGSYRSLPDVSTLADYVRIVGGAAGAVIERVERADGTAVATVTAYDANDDATTVTLTADEHLGTSDRIRVVHADGPSMGIRNARGQTTFDVVYHTATHYQTNVYDLADQHDWWRTSRDYENGVLIGETEWLDPDEGGGPRVTSRGNNWYALGRGDGVVRIATELGGTDTVVFGADITATDLVTERIGDDLIIGVLPNGHTGTNPAASTLADRIQIVGHADTAVIERFELSDGTAYVPTIPPATAAPIVIDLDGDGIELVTLEQSTAEYAWDGYGKKNRTAWIAADDAFLAIDADGDGRISKSYELAFTEWAKGVTSDMEAVRRVFDTNRNGKLDVGDDAWDRFGLLQDKNQDGITQPGEFRTLDKAGITQIDLTPHGPARRLPDGSEIRGTAAVTYADGTTATAGDIALAYQSEEARDAAIDRATDRMLVDQVRRAQQAILASNGATIPDKPKDQMPDIAKLFAAPYNT